jgi:D-apionolactonase
MTTLTKLFGTNEPQPDRRVLVAGPLTAVLETGNLRDIRWQGVEVLRAVNYLARDTSWGTYAAGLSNLIIKEARDHFRVTYSARCAGTEGRFDYAMAIVGTADGTLVLRAEGCAVTDFATNRVGFVVLHPSEVAGSVLRIDHIDGSARDMRFPDLIDPDPPVLDIRAMTHHPVPTLTVHVAFEGDAFEMEDQRNWADASFKTFVRPLSRPRPFVIRQGTVDVQSVTLRTSGTAPRGHHARSGDILALGPATGVMPQMALFCDRPSACNGDAAQLGKGIANIVIPRWQADAPDLLTPATRLADAIGARVAVEAILAARHPAAEARDVMVALDRAGLSGSTLLIAPAREFRSSPSGTLLLGEVSTDDLVRAVRAAGHGGQIGAGTPSYFPEFNRNPPGLAADFVYFGGAATIHAADDASVVETIGVTPAILATARHRVDRPIWFGPVTLAMRHTPYGAALARNPDHMRMAVAEEDPRHAALFGAAYATGIAARAAGAVACLTLAAPFGPFGLLAGGRATALSAIQRLLTGAAGSPAIQVGAGPHVAALGWIADGRTHVLVANLSPQDRPLTLPPGATRPDVVTFDGLWEPSDSNVAITLAPYRVMRFRVG